MRPPGAKCPVVRHVWRNTANPAAVAAEKLTLRDLRYCPQSCPRTGLAQTPHDPQNRSRRATPKRPSRRQAINRDNPMRNAMGTVKSNHRSRRPVGTAVRGTRRHGRHQLNLHGSPQGNAPEAGDPGRKVAALRDCRRQNRPRRRRRSHHQAAGTAVPHAGHIRRGERTKPCLA